MEADVTAKATGKSSREILRLVQIALDEFETTDLAGSVRRALRIAVLMGESQTAVRLSLELRPVGGHTPSNKADTLRLLADAGMASPDDPSGPVERAIEAYFGDRLIPGDPNGRLAAHSLEEIAFWERTLADLGEVADSQYQAQLASSKHMNFIVSNARQRTFALLCGWERQLTFSTTNDAILGAHQARVDAVLGSVAPDVLDQFNMVFRRLDEAAESDSSSIASELLSQAVTSCRRVLKAVVDVVQPVDPARRKTDDGHALNDSAYKNRLFEFLKSATKSDSASKALTTASTALWERFSAIDALSSKGVHAEVARDEAELCALNSYLLAGEVLQMHRRSAADAEPESPPAGPSTANVSS